MRTIIDLPEEQISGLARYCEEHAVSRAEAVREAVRKLLAESREARLQAAFDTVFGMWKDRGVTTDEYLEKLRSEWDR